VVAASIPGRPFDVPPDAAPLRGAAARRGGTARELQVDMFSTVDGFGAGTPQRPALFAGFTSGPGAHTWTARTHLANLTLR
jgi:hypothetical protein